MPSAGRLQQDAPGVVAWLCSTWLLAFAAGSLLLGILGCGGKPANVERVTPAPLTPRAAERTAPAQKAAPAATRSTCGGQGLPDCPLQRWMDHHLNGPLSRGEYAALARGFHDLAAVAPAGFTGWGAWAEGGAAAAGQRNHAAISQACTGCHDRYRERYRMTMRDRPMP
jgi:hypothetical protein